MTEKSNKSLRDTAESFPSKLHEESSGSRQDKSGKDQEVKIFGPDNRPLDKKHDMETAKELKPKHDRQKTLLTEKDQDFVPNLKRLADIDVDYQGKKK
ncbi:hypothetical protein MFMK1_003315 [Metallumcola ferriviriculae]|uniref:Uncharacterized protein n=1 Tax=Metallumcola ferriviriculae TaxID=3039180 RepID=A0AAU0UR62_9FIRM|nr:hypothetical protein MFMK1_003315 [Desulfitibacteraceae bacterium MK1]